MQKLELIIELKSPVLFAKQSGDSTMTNTLSYIPGSSVLGLLASRFLRGGGERRDFERMFLHGDIIFRNLYPYHNRRQYLPAKKHILMDKQSGKEFTNIYADVEITPDLKIPKGYTYMFGNNYAIHQPQTEIFFHHERDYSKGISKESVIFSYEALSEGQSFRGEIIGKKDDISQIKELLKKDEVLRLGKSKTAQYGNCSLVAIRESEYELEELEEDGSYVMTLLSDTIIKNEFGSSAVDINDMAKYLGVAISHSAIDKTKVETVVNAYRCKTPADHAFSAGSSFLLKELPENYMNMQKHGIGFRRHEGHGEVVFESLKSEMLYLDSHEPQATAKPQGDLPPLLKTITLDLIVEYMKKKFADKARENAFALRGRKPTKSLIGRLEAFAKSGDFSTSFNLLRKKAIRELEEMYIHGTDLHNYLRRIDENVDKLINEFKSTYVGERMLQDLIALIPKGSLDEIDFVSIYLNYLFNHLRKKIKAEEGEND